MLYLILAIFLGFLPTEASASFSRTEILQQQMDCASAYVNQGVLIPQQDPCYNQMILSKDQRQEQEIITKPVAVQAAVGKIENTSEQDNVQTEMTNQEEAQDSKEKNSNDEEITSKANQDKPVLKTRTHTFDLGTDVYYYRYTEPSVGVYNIGSMQGIYGTYTYRPPQGNVWNNELLNVYRLEARTAQGKINYKGSGHVKGKTDKMFELRGMVGRDYMLDDSSRVTPYFGLGYRFLFDPGDGVLSSDGHIGYDRKSHYWYMPIGMTADIPMAKDSEVSLNFEYDYFLQGNQTSYLSDADQFTTFPSTDIKNHQKDGFGLRGSIRFLKHYSPMDVYVEPFIRYWKIDNSNVKQGIFDGTVESFIEPKNETTEAGTKVGVQF